MEEQSFAALTTAFESLEVPARTNIPKKTSNSLLNLEISSSSSNESSAKEISRKRKKSPGSEDTFRSKALRANVGRLASQFRNSIQISENDSIEEGITTSHEEDTTVQIQDSNLARAELDSYLKLIMNNIPSDSYDDLRILVHRIKKLLKQIYGEVDIEFIPHQLWTRVRKTFTEMELFTTIIEDMKRMQQTVDITTLDTLDLFNLVQNTKEFINSKAALYQSCTRQNCLGWRVLGFPVKDVEFYITSFQDKLLIIVQKLIFKVLNEYQVHESTTISTDLLNWENPQRVLLEAIEINEDALKLIGNPLYVKQQLAFQTQLSLVYLKKSAAIIRSTTINTAKTNKFPDSKVCYIYENILHLFDLMMSSETILDTLPQISHQDTCSSLSSFDYTSPTNSPVQAEQPLIHTIIDLGLELCLYCARKRPLETQMQSLIYSLCQKYVSKAAVLCKISLDPAIVQKLQGIFILTLI